jgi:uncharacterized membrane protein YgdD (TMEM256/DUF423 family)
MRTWLLLASVNGFLAVLAGTLGAHGLPAPVAAQGFYGTAVLYHLVHALALLGTAILMELAPGRAPRALNAAGLFFLLGIVLFSGSLYLRALTDLHMFSPLVPVGGIAFLLGWLALGAAAFPQRSKA